MRKLFDWIILLGVVGAGAYIAYSHPVQLRHLARLIEMKVRPCTTPITYSIGTIDPHFGILRDEVGADLEKAEDIWENPSQRNLFAYQKEGGEVTVHFIYDERQQATEQLKSLGIEIDESKASYEALRARYDALAATVEEEQAAYKNRVAAYEEREAAYNAAVQRWNSEGGAPPAQYAKLNAEKEALRTDIASLRASEQKLNKDIDTLNALAITLNKLIVDLNLDVEQYNRTGAHAGEFEEGLYEVKNGIASITIFEYANEEKLVRVLAHELGHALGLEHVSDTSAIMYEINRGSELRATAADSAELARVCRIDT